jgi:hypothetical protein
MPSAAFFFLPKLDCMKKVIEAAHEKTHKDTDNFLVTVV